MVYKAILYILFCKNELVYQINGLTEEEISIVGGQY